MKIDYYEKLEVSSDSTEEQIKESYRVLAKMYHPDNHFNSTDKVKQMAGKKFNEIREAYKTLSDENLRLKYDKRRQKERQKSEDVLYDDELYDDEYVDAHEYQPSEHAYADYGRYGHDEHGNQLDDAIRDFRQGMPRTIKVAAVFMGVLGWVMFISLAFGIWGGNNNRVPTSTDFAIRLIMEENDELERQLEHYRQHSRFQQGIAIYYRRRESDLSAALAYERYINNQLHNALQHDDSYGELRQQINDLSAGLLIAEERLGLVRHELGNFIQMALDIHAVQHEMLAAMPGVPDALFTELWYRHVELLNNLQRLEANLAAAGVD